MQNSVYGCQDNLDAGNGLDVAGIYKDFYNRPPD